MVNGGMAYDAAVLVLAEFVAAREPGERVDGYEGVRKTYRFRIGT
jgi:hypothetical protein